MTTILRLGLNVLRKEIPILKNVRTIATTPSLQLKEIVEKQNGKELIIEGVYVPSPMAPYLVQRDEQKCPVCSLGLELKHTDVLIISQFVRSDGCMLPRRITGLCRKQQKIMASLVTMAQKAGLMPNLTPSWSKKDPKTRYKYKKYNKYFDEATIKVKELNIHS